jgi:hypothetical protein
LQNEINLHNIVLITKTKTLLKTTISSLFVFFTFAFLSQTSVVKIEKQNNQWELLVDGVPYYIKGGGGTVKMEELKAAGGNTIRTWGLENAQEILDKAHKLGLKVMLGLWVQHERHGFDYNDADKIKNQLEGFRVAVRKYKNHPALLMWGVGNEYELEYSNTKVWAAVNDIAKMIHEEDKNHPTSTVTAGTNAEKLNFVMTQLTEVDIYGINTYGDIENVKSVLEKGKFEGSYMITEWGPNGHWESPKTKWGSSIEQTSTEKAAVYLSRYQRCIADQRKQCIGSFAFLWGQKQEYTSTWYGLFSENGVQTEAVDELQFCWSGKYPENRSPKIEKLSYQTAEAKEAVEIKTVSFSAIFKAKEKIKVDLVASDLNQDKLVYTWDLYPESTDLKSGGDAENKPVAIPGKVKGDGATIVLKTPTNEGRYRLFVSVTDGSKVAYANFPFYVENDPDAQKNTVNLKKQTLKSFDEE